MEFRAGDLVEMDEGSAYPGLFLVLKLDKEDDPVVHILRPRPSSPDYAGEVVAFYANVLQLVAPSR